MSNVSREVETEADGASSPGVLPAVTLITGAGLVMTMIVDGVGFVGT